MKFIKNRKFSFPIIFILSLFIIGVIVIFVLSNCRTSTRIDLQCTVDQVIFKTVRYEEDPLSYQTILKSIYFNSVAINKFKEIKFTPSSFSVANPAKYKEKTDEYPDFAWKPVKFTLPLIIMGKDEKLLPAVTLESAKPNPNGLWNLDNLTTSPGAKVILKTISDPKIEYLTLTTEVNDQRASASLSFRNEFLLSANQVIFDNIYESPYNEDYLTYKGQLEENKYFFEIEGQPKSLILNFTLKFEDNNKVFSENIIQLNSIDLTRMNFKGILEPTTVENSETILSYPDYPDIQPLTINWKEFVKLEPVNKFCLDELKLDSENKGIRLHLTGVARKIKTGTEDFSRDYRLNMFDRLQQSKLTIVISIISWLMAAYGSAYSLIRGSKK